MSKINSIRFWKIIYIEDDGWSVISNGRNDWTINQENMNIGVCGAGTIASWISDILEQLNDDKIVKYGVASAFPEQCPPFAKKYGWKKIYDTYEEMMSDDVIDLIYIAVPNHLHLEVCMQALEHGKNVVVA